MADAVLSTVIAAVSAKVAHLPTVVRRDNRTGLITSRTTNRSSSSSTNGQRGTTVYCSGMARCRTMAATIGIRCEVFGAAHELLHRRVRLGLGRACHLPSVCAPPLTSDCHE